MIWIKDDCTEDDLNFFYGQIERILNIKDNDYEQSLKNWQQVEGKMGIEGI